MPFLPKISWGLRVTLVSHAPKQMIAIAAIAFSRLTERFVRKHVTPNVRKDGVASKC